MTKFELGKQVICTKDVQFFTKGNKYKIQNIGVNHITLLDDDAENNDWFIKDAEETFEIIPTKNQRITALEKEVAELLPLKEEVEELKLIVHQLRKPSTVVEEVSTSSVEDTIEYEGQRYKKVDREAREGDVVIFTKLPNYSGHDVTKGKPYKTFNDTDIFDQAILQITDDDNYNTYVYGGGLLKGTPETVEVYELIVEETAYPPFVIPEPVPVKSPNQLRAEIIEKAKGFIEDSKTTVTGPVLPGPDKGEIRTFENVYSVHEIGISKTACNAEFVVNEEKRTIVALLRGIDTNKIYHRGIAKCHPNNVFNEHIGRAIALGRALGLDVSEFEQAVQPTLAIGQIVVNDSPRVGKFQGIEFIVSESTIGKGYIYDKEFKNGGRRAAIDSNFVEHSTTKIINDTNAIYGGVE